LFKQGDELQRAGRFAEALDKFERAQQAFSAPTNELRIAECNAALGRLVESAEAYRTVVRTPLPAGSPPAFQAAVDQAKAELEQVEPRVPKIIVQVQPAVSAASLQIDGQNVPPALLGASMPLDPGTHRVSVVAQGYGSAEQVISLKERETRPVQFVLTPLPPAPSPPQNGAPSPPTGAPPPPAPPAPYGSAPPPPPPPPPPGAPSPVGPRPSRFGLLFGGHIGAEFLTGKIPLPTGEVESSSIASGGFTYGLDAGFRFARHWYVGALLDHANFGQGTKADFTPNTVASVSSDTTLLGVTFAFVGHPDLTSFYGEVGLANRWFHYSTKATPGTTATPSNDYSGGEFTLGLGIWIPVGRSFRLLPKATVGIGSFDVANDAETTNAPVHTFFMLGIDGLYNLDF
jgi:hypothetical protein